MVCYRQPRSAHQGWGNLFSQLFYIIGLKIEAAEGPAQQLISKEKEPSCTGSSTTGVKWTNVRWNTPAIDLFVIQVWDCVPTPCVWSVNLQLFPKLRFPGTDRSDQEDECFLPWGTFPDDPTQEAKHTCWQEVGANPCCAATLQRELILLQFQTASQSFNILIHSML